MMDVGRAILVLPMSLAAAALAMVIAAAVQRRRRHRRRARKRQAFFQFHRPGGGHFGQDKERR
jgi:hypothetical protein